MRVVLYWDTPNSDGNIEQGYVDVSAIKILDRGTVDMVQGNGTFLAVEVNDERITD